LNNKNISLYYIKEYLELTFFLDEKSNKKVKAKSQLQSFLPTFSAVPPEKL